MKALFLLLLHSHPSQPASLGRGTSTGCAGWRILHEQHAVVRSVIVTPYNRQTDALSVLNLAQQTLQLTLTENVTVALHNHSLPGGVHSSSQFAAKLDNLIVLSGANSARFNLFLQERGWQRPWHKHILQ